jgi:hypothetical protein
LYELEIQRANFCIISQSQSVSEGVTALGPYLLLLVIMAILGSLVGVFTFCVRRKVGVCKLAKLTALA